MNPLQIASLTSAITPLAASTVRSVVDVLTPDQNPFHKLLSGEPTRENTQASSESQGEATRPGSFQQLYQKLKDKLTQLMGARLSSAQASEVEVTVNSQGQFRLHSNQLTEDEIQPLQEWLNQQHDLAKLASQAVDSKQRQDWSQQLPLGTSPATLNLRLEFPGRN